MRKCNSFQLGPEVVKVMMLQIHANHLRQIGSDNIWNNKKRFVDGYQLWFTLFELPAHFLPCVEWSSFPCCAICPLSSCFCVLQVCFPCDGELVTKGSNRVLKCLFLYGMVIFFRLRLESQIGLRFWRTLDYFFSSISVVSVLVHMSKKNSASINNIFLLYPVTLRVWSKLNC